MPEEFDRDWMGFAMQLAVYAADGEGKATTWRVIQPGTAGSNEEALQLSMWREKKDDPAYTNDMAASVGWPLPHPETATALQLRAYDRERFYHGRIIRQRREAAILAPGDFPDVDTSYDPPIYMPTAAMPTTEAEPTGADAGMPSDSAAPASDAGSAAVAVADVAMNRDEQRVPVVGERVVVTRGGELRFMATVVQQVTDKSDDIVAHTAIVAIDGYQSGPLPALIVGWPK